MTEKQQLQNELSTVEASIIALELDNEQIKQQMLTAPWDEQWVYQLRIEMNEVGTSTWPWQGLIGETPNIETLKKQQKKLVWKLNSMKQGADTTTDSGQFTDEDIAQAKAVPLEQFYDGDKLRKMGGKLWGKCEFHAEKTASFAIYLNQNSWWCYACSTGGDVIAYVMKKQNLDFVQAVKLILNKN